MTNKKIAFKPHETRGQEIIKILEGMGGVNKYNLDGSKGIIAIEINRGDYITNDWDMMGLWRLGYEVYTLETWEEKTKPKMVNLDKVCEWLEKNIWVYINYEGCSGEELENDVIEDLRKAMEK